MALVKQNIPVAFGKGIDTKVDPKQQLLTTFRQARNVTYETIFSVRKRNGYRRIQLQTTDAQLIDGAQKLTRFKDELNVFADNTLYSMTGSTEKLTEKGRVYSVFPTSVPVLNGAYSHTTCDVTVVEGFECYAYSNANDEIRYSVRDSTNNTLLTSNTLVGAGQQAKISFLGGSVYIVYADGTSLRYRRFSINSPGTLEPAVTIANNLDGTNDVYDLVMHNDKIYIAYNSSVGAARIRVVAINSDGTLYGGLGITSSVNGQAVTIFGTAGGDLLVAAADNSALTYFLLNNTLASITLTATTIESLADIKNVTVLELAGGQFTLWYEVGGSTPDKHYIKKAVFNSVGAQVEAPGVFIRSVGLVAKAYTYDSLPYVPTVFGQPIQSTAFILDQNAVPVAKFSVGLAGGLQTVGSVPKVKLLSGSKYVVPSLYKTRTEAEDSVFFSAFGVMGTVIEHAVANPLQNAELANNLHIAGGILMSYDGDEVAEHGFHMYPDGIATGAFYSTTGGGISDGSRGYVAVYRWTDNFGQEHRSAVSGLHEVNFTGGTGTQQIGIAVPTLRLTQKTEIVVELYRTEVNGSVFFLTASAANDSSVDSIEIIDNRSDASLISELPLYTTGGVLDNAPAPSCRLLAVHTGSERLVAVGEQDNVLIVSKIPLAGQPVTWNEALQYNIDPIGGRITALASMDEKLVIFKRSAVLFISGGGPNNLGQQDTFTTPERVAIDVGCVEPESVVLVPQGLMFKSEKGIYLLSRSLQLQYIGAAVEGFNGLSITSAKIVATANEVRFTTSDGETLVFNYNLGLWSTFDNHQALSAEVVGNTYYYVRSSTELFVETPGVYSDNSSPISILLETGWMSFANLQGFQRIYRMLVLGDWKSEHLLRVRAAYDFNDAWTHEKVLDPTPDIVSGVPYGGNSPYGSGSPYGGDGDVYQARFDFAKQKCQAVKLQFSDQQSVSGEGLSLSAFTLLVGGKTGLFKPKQAKIKGIA